MKQAKKEAAKALCSIYGGLYNYATAHRDMYDSPIGDDGVLGPAWLDALKGLRTLLNGETGDLDCGDFDARIVALASENGFDGEEL